MIRFCARSPRSVLQTLVGSSHLRSSRCQDGGIRFLTSLTRWKKEGERRPQSFEGVDIENSAALLPVEVSEIVQKRVSAFLNKEDLLSALTDSLNLPIFFLRDPRVLRKFEVYLRSLRNAEQGALLQDLRAIALGEGTVGDYTSLTDGLRCVPESFPHGQKLEGETHVSCLLERMRLTGVVSPSELESILPLLWAIRQFLYTFYSEHVLSFQNLRNVSDLRKPAEFESFRGARAYPREVHLHIGPTNSGKTHAAMTKLFSLPVGQKGVYCAPLRLLALEGFQRMCEMGLACELITGQERKLSDAAEKGVPVSHTACTIEMTNLSEPFQIAVVDEYQLIADRDRGAAWTRALLGLRCEELHLCGDGTGRKLLRSLLEDQCGDLITSHSYERLSPLFLEPSFVPALDQLGEGDCLICFSRLEILRAKSQLELLGKRVCVVYGSLPPETRQDQVRAFNEGGKYDVLVASDCIGLGLNFQIGRVVFAGLRKYDGKDERFLVPSEIRQIAGRAGRFKGKYPEGRVSCMHEEDLPILYEAFGKHHVASEIDLVEVGTTIQSFPPDPRPPRFASVGEEEVNAEKAGIFPLVEQVESFYEQLVQEEKASQKTGSSRGPLFSEVLTRFLTICRTDPQFFLSGGERIKAIARSLDDVPGLSVKQKFDFCMAPTPSEQVLLLGALRTFAQYLGSFRQVPLPGAYRVKIPVPLPDSMQDLLALEMLCQVYDMYLWLSRQLGPSLFPSSDEVEADLRPALVKAISDGVNSSLGDEVEREAQAAFHALCDSVQNDVPHFLQAADRNETSIIDHDYALVKGQEILLQKNDSLAKKEIQGGNTRRSKGTMELTPPTKAEEKHRLLMEGLSAAGEIVIKGRRQRRSLVDL